MSFERRISSLPLYTRNLHIFQASADRLVSEATCPGFKHSMTEDEEKGPCCSYRQYAKLALSETGSLQVSRHVVSLSLWTDI